MKRMVLVLFLAVFFAAFSLGVTAQVTIGAESDPHPGAVLDLQSGKGLKLPVVDIYNANDFQLSGNGDQAAGMMVYNTWEKMTDGQGVGVYIWNGSKWLFIAISGGTAEPVTQITVTSAADEVMTGGAVQFFATVYPTSATNKNYSWSVVPNPGNGVVDTNGSFTADHPGKVKVRATAQDGSNVYGEKEITVLPASTQVINITITAEGSATTLNAGQTLAMSAIVLPADATNKTVTWTIISGAAANINSTTGLVTGTGNGNVTVQASATDGSSVVSNPYVITVAQTTGATTVEGYNVYCYPNNLGCWMTDNSRLGTPSRTRYGYAVNEVTQETVNGTNPSASSGERGYYYTWANATVKSGSQYTACPTDYHLPNTTEWNNLKSYLNGSTANAAEKAGWLNADELAGFYNVNNSTWYYWGNYGNWWSSGVTDQYFHASPSAMFGPSINSGYYFSVRCVKSN